MATRVKPGTLRRELRFSESAVDSNLQTLGLSFNDVRPLTLALTDSQGFLNLPGTELLLLEKVLGLSAGTPAVQLVGELVLVKAVPANTGVSYGYLAQTASPTNLGLIGIGFSDGLPRSSTNNFKVSIDGKTYPGIGRMAMDQCVIDLGADSPKLGSEVVFFGSGFSLADFAEATGFTQLEILGRITSRVARMWSE